MNIILTAVLLPALLIGFMLPTANLQRSYVNCAGTKCLCDNWSREMAAFRNQIRKFANGTAQSSCAARYCRETTTSPTGICRSNICKFTSTNRQCSMVSLPTCKPKLGVDPYGDYIYILQLSTASQPVREQICRTPFKTCCSCSPEKRCVQRNRRIGVVGINLRDGRCGIHYLNSCCGCSCGSCCNPSSRYQSLEG